MTSYVATLPIQRNILWVAMEPLFYLSVLSLFKTQTLNAIQESQDIN